MEDFLPTSNPYLLILILALLYYMILIPLYFKPEAMQLLGKFLGSSTSTSIDEMTKVFKEYREWLELVEKLKPDQKVKAVYAIENTDWLKQKPFRTALDLDQVWQEKIHRQQLSNIKNQTNIS